MADMVMRPGKAPADQLIDWLEDLIMERVISEVENGPESMTVADKKLHNQKAEPK